MEYSCNMNKLVNCCKHLKKFVFQTLKLIKICWNWRVTATIKIEKKLRKIHPISSRSFPSQIEPYFIFYIFLFRRAKINRSKIPCLASDCLFKISFEYVIVGTISKYNCKVIAKPLKNPAEPRNSLRVYMNKNVGSG